ncbi:MAG TPA: outer membrane protein [Xanthobacteraceae bacterium]|nr:outer membrane protein [Xanthobacteraceae bacterium]
MKKFSVAVLGLLLGSSFASAADMPVPYAPVAPWSWTGLYIGAHVGGGFVSSQFSDPAGSSIYGDSVRSPAALAGFQIGYNWQIPNSSFLLGAEADASSSIGDGTVTCLASSGIFVSANCRVRPQANGSLTGRVGYVTGPRGHTLIYAKAGAAWLQEQIDITTNFSGFNAAPPATSFDGVRWGWTIGGGVEKALTPAWSVKLEYDYANFGDLSASTPGSFVLQFPFAFSTPGSTTSVSQSLQTLKVGINYKIGEDLSAQWEPSASDYRLRGATDPGYIPDAEIEVGGRVWYSSGKFQKDLGASFDPAQQNQLISRLTYDSTAASGELFGRVDTPTNIFLKGFVGGGKLLSGKMHDEDWLLFDAIPYSNTVSTVKGDLAYATFDVGYSVFRGHSANVGGFIGYNYFRENKQAFGCVQIANSNSDCVPALANSVLGITEDDKWNSMRIGINSVVRVADRLTLTSDAAYLPFVSFTGTDNHLLRTGVPTTVSPETAAGRGVQLEAILSYAIANSFSVGAGGRYWAMWAPGNSDTFGFGCPCQTLPVRTERFGAFLQASYKLDGLK